MDAEAPRHDRSDSNLLVQRSLAIGLAITGLGMALLGGDGWGVRITGLVLLVIGAALDRRLRSHGISVDREGIIVHGVLRETRHEWTDIEGFEVGSGTNLVQPTCALHVVLSDGRRLPPPPGANYFDFGVAGLLPGAGPLGGGFSCETGFVDGPYPPRFSVGPSCTRFAITPPTSR